QHINHRLGILAPIALLCVASGHCSRCMTHPDLDPSLRRALVREPLTVAVAQVVESQIKRSPRSFEGTLPVGAKPLVLEGRRGSCHDPRPEPLVNADYVG